MIPLAASVPPASASSLCEALRGGCAGKRFSVQEVKACALHFPRMESLDLDLSGTQLDSESSFHQPTAAPLDFPIYEVQKFSLHASPLLWEDIAADFEVKISNARFGLVPEGEDQFSLLLQQTGQGDASVKIAVADLQAAAERWIKKAAAQQGAEIKKTVLKLHLTGPRSGEIELEITAKIFVMTATLVIRGRVSIEDAFEIRFSGWTCAGESMITSAANALLKPRFEQLENQRLSLGTLARAVGLGFIEFRDIRMECGEYLQLDATW
jgi:hypothetical protein